MAKPSEILKKSKQKDEYSNPKDKDDKKKPGKNSMLSWIADNKKC